jgi:hypothetical protein
MENFGFSHHFSEAKAYVFIIFLRGCFLKEFRKNDHTMGRGKVTDMSQNIK